MRGRSFIPSFKEQVNRALEADNRQRSPVERADAAVAIGRLARALGVPREERLTVSRARSFAREALWACGGPQNLSTVEKLQEVIGGPDIDVERAVWGADATVVLAVLASRMDETTPLMEQIAENADCYLTLYLARSAQWFVTHEAPEPNENDPFGSLVDRLRCTLAPWICIRDAARDAGLLGDES